MSNTSEDGDGASVTTGGLFPVFPTSANSVSAFSGAPQWLRNASFTTDLSVINAAASTAPSLSEVEAGDEEDEKGDADGNIGEANQPRVYNLVEEEESLESDGDKVMRKRGKKKKRKSGNSSDESRSRKSSVKASDEYYSKPVKDYYLDTRPDPDNLAYGSIYRYFAYNLFTCVVMVSFKSVGILKICFCLHNAG